MFAARVTLWTGLASLVIPAPTAYAHGLTPALLGILLGILAVHIAPPAFLLASSRFAGQRGRVFGGYAAIMAVYYAIMWFAEVDEMFFFPVVPVFLVVVLYFTVRPQPDQP